MRAEHYSVLQRVVEIDLPVNRLQDSADEFEDLFVFLLFKPIDEKAALELDGIDKVEHFLDEFPKVGSSGVECLYPNKIVEAPLIVIEGSCEV
jgi:hypothetical protein